MQLNEYKKFVYDVTSIQSKSMKEFIEQFDKFEEMGVNLPLLITAEVGLSGETGEFSDLFKKVLFQGKPFTDETKEHLIKELGDIIFYWANACNALNLNPDDVINKNFKKLSERYPNGFEEIRSENRRKGDV